MNWTELEVKKVYYTYIIHGKTKQGWIVLESYRESVIWVHHVNSFNSVGDTVHPVKLVHFVIYAQTQRFAQTVVHEIDAICAVQFGSFYFWNCPIVAPKKQSK